MRYPLRHAGFSDNFLKDLTYTIFKVKVIETFLSFWLIAVSYLNYAPNRDRTYDLAINSRTL